MEQGDVYLADMNPPRKSKPGKIRPVLVLQSSDLTLAGKKSITVVPFTTQLRPPRAFRRRITPKDLPGLHQDSDILVDEIHTLHRSLLIENLGRAPRDLLEKVLEEVFFILGRVRPPRKGLMPRAV